MITDSIVIPNYLPHSEHPQEPTTERRSAGFTPPTLAGHRAGLVKVFFASAATQRSSTLAGETPATLYTISSDGALHAYAFTPTETEAEEEENSEAEEDSSSDDGREGKRARVDAEPAQSRRFAHGKWLLIDKHYFRQDNTTLTAADYHPASSLLVTTFSSGCFLLHQLPALEHLQVTH